MDDVLLYLLKRGAASNPVKLSTTEMGNALGMTQQNASRRLALLINSGRISRHGEKLSITQKGVSELRELYSGLRLAFEGIDNITGSLIDGVGDGRYYLALPGYKSKIKEKFGILPYPGTLNIKLAENEVWKKSALFDGAFVVPGFRYDGRAFGELSVKACSIGSIPVVAVLPKRTHHPYNVLELVSDRNLRRALRIKSGDKVTVSI